jgi:Na+/melibiose symporter-like transporter
MILCIIVITTGIATAMHQSALAQYLIYGLKAPELASALMPLLYVGAFVAALLAKPLARFDKLRMTKLSFVVVAFGLGLRFFTKDATMPIVIIGEVILGLGAGLFSVYVLTLLMDTIEYGYLKNGTRNDGLIMSTLSFQQKIGQGVGISIMGFWLAASGYVSGSPEQSEAVAKALFNIHLLPLFITSILSLIILQFFYKLDAKTVEGIISDIKARDVAAAEGAESAAPEAVQDGEES